MTTLVIFTGRYPHGDAATHRIHLLCKGLLAAGVAVEILIPHPTESSRQPGHGEYETVPFSFIGGITRRQPNRLIRKCIDIILHGATLYKVLRSTHDWVIINGPSVDFRMWIPLLRRLSGKKTLLEINEFPFIYPADTINQQRKRWFYNKVVLPQFQAVVAISRPLKEYLCQESAGKAPILEVPILLDPVVDIMHHHACSDSGDYIVHTGSLSESKDGIRSTLMVLALLRDHYQTLLRLFITGSVSEQDKNALLQLANQWQLRSQIEFTGYLPASDLNGLIRNSRFALINKADNLQNKYCFPTKLGLYLSHAVPVICTDTGVLKDFLEHGKHAIVVPAGDEMQLATAAYELLQSPERACTLGLAGQEQGLSAFHYLSHGVRLANWLRRL